MRRILLLSVVVVVAAVALAVGSYSVVAGTGPVAGVAGALIGSGESDDANGENGDGDDASEDEEVGAQDDDSDNGEGAQHIAQVIADAFGVSQQDVLALHDQEIGFGALFHLGALAAAMGMSVDDLLATIPTDGDGKYQFDFGKLRKALSEEQQAVLESGSKNLGQLVAASHRPEGAGPGAVNETAATGLEKAHEKFAAGVSRGRGPPESVPAHGRN